MMDPAVVAALIGAGTIIIGIILTAVLTHQFTLRAERQRILLELEERRKYEEETEKKVAIGTWEDIEQLVRARARVARAGQPGLIEYLIILILIGFITTCILLVIGSQIGNVWT